MRSPAKVNDICFQVAWWLEETGPMFSEGELLKLEKRLAGRPHVKLAESIPYRAVRAPLGCKVSSRFGP